MSSASKRVYYLAAPMRGKEKYNWPLFDSVSDELLLRGIQCITPADLDRDFCQGMEGEDSNALTDEECLAMVPNYKPAALIANSMQAMLLSCTDIILLPGWKKSRGCLAELAAARAADMGVYVWKNEQVLPFIDDEEDDDLLQEAIQITSHDRQTAYGAPNKDFKIIAALWKALFGWDVTEEKVALAMICLKLSRLSNSIKPDSIRDVAGYARCLYQVWIGKERERRGGPIESGGAAGDLAPVQTHSGSEEAAA